MPSTPPHNKLKVLTRPQMERMSYPNNSRQTIGIRRSRRRSPTPWPSPCTGSTKPSASGEKDPGEAGLTLRSRRRRGSAGGTTSASTQSSTTSPGGVRGSLLPSKGIRSRGWKPIAGVSIKHRAVQFASLGAPGPSRARARPHNPLCRLKRRRATSRHPAEPVAGEHPHRFWRRHLHLALTHRLSHPRSRLVGQKLHQRDLVSRTFRFEPPKSGQQA